VLCTHKAIYSVLIRISYLKDSYSPWAMTHSHYPSRRRTFSTFFRSLTCFGTSKTRNYTTLSSDSLPLLDEKPSFYPTIPTAKDASKPFNTSKSFPSPPRLTRWPSSHNLKARRSVVVLSEVHDPELPPADKRTAISTRPRAHSTPETELVDEISLVDAANMLGAAAGVVGTGYAGAAYHQQRKQVKEERRQVADVEMALRRDQGTQAEISIEVCETGVDELTCTEPSEGGT